MTTLSRAHTPFLLLFLSLGVVQLVDGKDLYALEAFLESFAELLLEKLSSLYTFGAIMNCTLRLRGSCPEKGVRREDIPAFLHEQMWRDWRGGADVFRSLRVLIAKYHPL